MRENHVLSLPKGSRTVRGGRGWKPGYGRGTEALSKETESKRGCPHLSLRRHPLTLRADLAIWSFTGSLEPAEEPVGE